MHQKKASLITVFTLMVSLLVSAQTARAQGAPSQIDISALQQMAAKQVLVSARSQRADIRANAIEAAEALPRRRGVLAEAGLRDPDPVVRFASLVVIGKMKIVAVAAGARNLINDPNDSVRAAAYFALARCFGTNRNANPMAIDITPIAAMALSENPNTRANAALILGLLGDKSSIQLLRAAATRSAPRVAQVKQRLVNLQIAEAIVRLGDNDAIDAIRAGAFSQFDEVRVDAINMLGRAGDRRFEPAFLQILDADTPIEVKVAASGTLARFGRGEGLDVVLKSALSDNPVLRAQAAYVLGLFRNQPAMQLLGRMLNDKSEQVRISAAAAILGGGRDGL